MGDPKHSPGASQLLTGKQVRAGHGRERDGRDAEKDTMLQRRATGKHPTEREDSTMRILVCQMGGCASIEMGEIKISTRERLIRKYDINLHLFMELNYNWAKVNSSANLTSWFMDNKRKMRFIMAHNTKEDDTLFGKHQPGGTGMLCQHKYLQYAQRPTADPRGLG
jgi:hypothetical protein